MLAGLVRSGFSVHGTWPMRTERGGRSIGIGTNAPTQKLDVNGSIKISGNGNGLVFPDGTYLLTAPTGAGGNPSGTSVITAINDPTASGTINDARLSPNVARLGAQNAWSGQNTFVNGLLANGVAITNVGNPVSATDDATVTINNVPPAATLTKTVTMAVVTFQVVVTNDSSAEPLGLSSLRDDQFGDITASNHDGIVSTTCAVPQTIPVGGRYTCAFNAKVSTSPHVNTVTGTISDDDGGTITRSGSATVQFQ